MIGNHIRSRMAFATLFPLLLVVIGTAAAFWHWRVQDLEDAHQQRIRLVTHQFAIFCANGLFSGNMVSLQNVMTEIQREPGLVAVYVFDAEGNVVASSGGLASVAQAELLSPEYISVQRSLDIDVLSEKIQTAVLPIDDLFSLGHKSMPLMLGNTVLEFSRSNVDNRKRQSLLVAIAIGGLGLAIGGLLAFQLGNGVVQPIMRIYQMINRIGGGDFSTSGEMNLNDPLRALQNSLNVMARRLAWGRDEMENRVQSVTRELRQKMEQAESATQAKSKFLAAASHDLRQPAHALGMFVARQRQLPMDAQMRHLVDQMDASVQSMQDLLDSLLDLSRLDSGAVHVRVANICLNDVLQSVDKLVGTLATTKGLRLRVRPTTLGGRSDVFLLQRMIANLALNAVRYTVSGTVLIACRSVQGGKQVRIDVWDSGIGIAPEHHRDIFKEFFQLQSHIGERSFGMGLGLNIVQRSAQLLGHKILVRSSPGCGSRFSIVLDGTDGRPRDPQAAATMDVPNFVDFAGAAVLVIEDNANALAAMAGLLESWGCSVLAAPSLMEAQELISAQGVPDVILTDYHLGAVGSGIDAVSVLRTFCGSPIPACLISGETHEDLQAMAQAAQLTLLHKPVRPAKLRTLLRRLLATDAA